MLTALVFAHLGEHKRAEKLFRKSYVRATTFRKTPHAVRWLLHKHLVRSGNLGYEAADRPKLPEWTPDYTDLTVDLENLFDRMDINKNGSLSRNELRAGLIDAGYEAEDVVKRLPLLFKSMDRNEDGRISKYEFILHFDSHDKLLSPVYERGTLDNAVNMGRLFDRVDTDKNGLLSRNELHDALMQEGYEFEDIVQRLPRLFSTMDNDGDGKITKAEFVSHFDVYKGFSPIGSPSRSPARKPPGGSSTSPPRQVQSPTVDIVDKVVGGIQAATEARERAEAQEAAHDVESEATGKRQQSAGSHRSSWRPGSEDSDEKEQDQGPAGPLTGGVAVYHAGLVATMDFGVDRITPSVPVSRPVSGHQIEGFEASATIARSRGVSASSSTIGSSIGTEDAREELDKLGRNAVEMVDDIFLDVIGSFPSPMESVTEFRTPQVLDNEIPGAGKLLRPLSAPGVGRKPSRLMELVSGARRPQTAGPVRHHSALKAAIRATALEDDGDEESAQDAVPRLSISAVGRARERRRLDAIDARDDAGNTSLHSAARDNDVEAVKSLLEAGANAAAANKIGEAPIHTAARAGNLRMVKLLASAVPNINQPGPEGRTALHFAVESGSLGLVQTLCETFGSDIAYQTNSGETAAQLAVRVLGSYAPVARYLSGLMTSLPAI
jgi:Ca2+-binding EF-hand superfamily protein